MNTYIKILELSAALGYLKIYLFIGCLTLLVIAMLFLLRKKTGTKTATLCSLMCIAGLSVYLSIEYRSVSRMFRSNHPIFAIRKFMEDQAMEAEDFAADFEEIDQYVRTWYELDQQKNLSLDELYRSYGMQVLRAKTKRKTSDVLLRYFGELKNNHTALCYRRRQAPAKAEWRGDSLYVSFCYWETPMEIGDRIVKINGKDVLAMRNPLMKFILLHKN